MIKQFCLLSFNSNYILVHVSESPHYYLITITSFCDIAIVIPLFNTIVWISIRLTHASGWIYNSLFERIVLTKNRDDRTAGIYFFPFLPPIFLILKDNIELKYKWQLTELGILSVLKEPTEEINTRVNLRLQMQEDKSW